MTEGMEGGSGVSTAFDALMAFLEARGGGIVPVSINTQPEPGTDHVHEHEHHNELNVGMKQQMGAGEGPPALPALPTPLASPDRGGHSDAESDFSDLGAFDWDARDEASRAQSPAPAVPSPKRLRARSPASSVDTEGGAAAVVHVTTAARSALTVCCGGCDAPVLPSVYMHPVVYRHDACGYTSQPEDVQQSYAKAGARWVRLHEVDVLVADVRCSAPPDPVSYIRVDCPTEAANGMGFRLPGRSPADTLVVTLINADGEPCVISSSFTGVKPQNCQPFVLFGSLQEQETGKVPSPTAPSLSAAYRDAVHDVTTHAEALMALVRTNSEALHLPPVFAETVAIACRPVRHNLGQYTLNGRPSPAHMSVAAAVLESCVSAVLDAASDTVHRLWGPQCALHGNVLGCALVRSILEVVPLQLLPHVLAMQGRPRPEGQGGAWPSAALPPLLFTNPGMPQVLPGDLYSPRHRALDDLMSSVLRQLASGSVPPNRASAPQQIVHLRLGPNWWTPFGLRASLLSSWNHWSLYVAAARSVTDATLAAPQYFEAEGVPASDEDKALARRYLEANLGSAFSLTFS